MTDLLDNTSAHTVEQPSLSPMNARLRASVYTVASLGLVAYDFVAKPFKKTRHYYRNNLAFIQTQEAQLIVAQCENCAEHTRKYFYNSFPEDFCAEHRHFYPYS